MCSAPARVAVQMLGVAASQSWPLAKFVLRSAVVGRQLSPSISVHPDAQQDAFGILCRDTEEDTGDTMQGTGYSGLIRMLVEICRPNPLISDVFTPDYITIGSPAKPTCPDVSVAVSEKVYDCPAPRTPCRATRVLPFTAVLKAPTHPSLKSRFPLACDDRESRQCAQTSISEGGQEETSRSGLR